MLRTACKRKKRAFGRKTRFWHLISVLLFQDLLPFSESAKLVFSAINSNVASLSEAGSDCQIRQKNRVMSPFAEFITALLRLLYLRACNFSVKGLSFVGVLGVSLVP